MSTKTAERPKKLSNIFAHYSAAKKHEAMARTEYIKEAREREKIGHFAFAGWMYEEGGAYKKAEQCYEKALDKIEEAPRGYGMRDTHSRHEEKIRDLIKHIKAVSEKGKQKDKEIEGKKRERYLRENMTYTKR